jgi:hypothetical protein
MSTKVFQLSALSQNDPGAADGSELCCKIIGVCNGTLREGSFSVNENVQLPTPPGQNGSGPTPSWFLIPENGLEGIFTIEIFCPTDSTYPSTTITVAESEVKKWASVPFNERDNQIYQEGEYGVFGFSQDGANGVIYTITAGVLNPRKEGS